MKNSKDLRIDFDAVTSDLKAFFEFIDSDQLRLGKNALADEALAVTELRKLIPDSAIKVVMTVTDPAALALLLAECEESVRSDVERARDLAQEHFPDLRSHPAVLEILREHLSSSSTEQQGAMELNSIRKIAYMPMYLGNAPTLVPAVRVAFRDSRGKLLLDSLLDWDDLLYVSRALADIAADEFQAAEKLCEARMLNRDEEFCGKLGKHIRELSQHVERLQRLAPQYGVQLEES